MKIIGSSFSLMKILVFLLVLRGLEKCCTTSENTSSCCSILRQQSFRIPLFYCLVTFEQHALCHSRVFQLKAKLVGREEPS